MRAGENVSFSNIDATTAAFVLRGGFYGVDVIADWGGGSVTLEKLAGDGATFVTVGSAITENGYLSQYLPPGTYKFVIATATGVYISVQRIPGE